MENALSWIRTIALVVVAVAVIPLTSNQCMEQAARKHNKAEAVRLATLGRAAREAKDPQLAVEAFSQASSADPLNNAYRVATLEATVEMIIEHRKFIGQSSRRPPSLKISSAATERRPLNPTR